MSTEGIMAQTAAERQRNWRNNHRKNYTRVTLYVPPDVAPEVRALEKWLCDMLEDCRVVAVTAQINRTGRLVSKRL
jgi:hypothetical protein